MRSGGEGLRPQASGLRPAARALFAALVVIAACHGGGDEGSDDDKPAPAAVTCRPVAQTTVDDTVEVTGVIATPPLVDAIVSSPVSGRVGQVLVEPGDHVTAGQLLAVIQDPALPAGTLEAQAAVESAQAADEAAKQELARQQRLVATGIGARKDLDDARARAAAAAAQLSAAKARSHLAGAQLERAELRAPRAGVVLHVWKKVGETVDGTSATPVAEVADLTVLELHAQVPPAALAPLREGMAAEVHVIGIDAPIHAKVVRIDPALDPKTLLGQVRLQLDSADGLKVGSAATGRVVIAQRPGVVVPATALRRSLVGADEVVTCTGGAAHVVPVTVGNRDARGVEILSGLTPGTQVVTDHVLGLEDGQPLVPEKGT